jgi:hypothetical protein
LWVEFTGPSYVEVVDVIVRDESHPGSLCSSTSLPWSLKSPSPGQHSLEVSFDNTIAGLREGQSATGVLSVLWARLNGVVEEQVIPLEVIARSSFQIVYDQSAPWSSQTVYSGDQVTITNEAEVDVDRDQVVAQLSVESGALKLNTDHDLRVTQQLSISSESVIEITDGALTLEAMSLQNQGMLRVNGGTLSSDMGGFSRRLAGEGLLELTAGSIAIVNGAPQNTLDIDADVRISGGSAAFSGQVRLGLNAPATFEIIGDEATISMVRLNMTGTINKGTLRFVLDESGVSMITVPGWMHLGASTLVVDGSAYTGGPDTFMLLNSVNLASTVPLDRIILTGFAERGLSARIEQDTGAGDWVRLVIE